jgi:hypothetical protein
MRANAPRSGSRAAISTRAVKSFMSAALAQDANQYHVLFVTSAEPYLGATAGRCPHHLIVFAMVQAQP